MNNEPGESTKKASPQSSPDSPVRQDAAARADEAVPAEAASDNFLQRMSGRFPLQLHRHTWPTVAAMVLIGAVFAVCLNVDFHRKPKEKAAAAATPVAVAKVTRQNVYNIVPVPAEFRPYVQVDLHAKVSGYVKDMNVDFGDRVKAGQLLATLEVPELNDQLNQAIAAERRAEADYTNAHLIYTRLQGVDKEHPNLVAQQDLDTAEARDHTTKSAIAEARANRERYQTLLGYTRITAPFDGVITHRYADPGALIQAGTSSETQSLPLLQVSDNYHLRLDFPVEVKYVKEVHVGAPVEVRVESLGGRTFTGTITRTTDKVSEDTRTMTTEIEVPNPNLELVPGMYAIAKLKVEQQTNALTIPTQAVSGDKSTVLVVNKNNELEERPVKLGLETPNRYEVVAGLAEGDFVVIGSRTELKAGQKVEPKVVDSDSLAWK